MNHIKAMTQQHFPTQPEGFEQGSAKFCEVGSEFVRACRQLVPVNGNTINADISLLMLYRPFGANNADLEASITQGCRLGPDARICRYRQILHQHEYLARFSHKLLPLYFHLAQHLVIPTHTPL